MNHKSLTVFALVVLAIGCQGSSSTQFSDAPTDVIEKIRLSDLAGSLIAYPPEDQAILLDSFNDKAHTNLDQHTPDRAPGSSRWVNVSGQWGSVRTQRSILIFAVDRARIADTANMKAVILEAGLAPIGPGALRSDRAER